MKKKLLSWLVSIVVIALLAGGRAVISEIITNSRIDDLAGTWRTYEQELDREQSNDTVTQLLENWDFYQEELELAADVKLKLPIALELGESRRYSIHIDGDSFRTCVCEMFDEVLDALYDGRENLVESYGEVVMTMTRDEFRQAYAEMYELASDSELIAAFADTAYDYEEVSEAVETGTYTVKGKKILFTITGESEAEYVAYQLSGDSLTLTYSDCVLNYSRMD